MSGNFLIKTGKTEVITYWNIFIEINSILLYQKRLGDATMENVVEFETNKLALTAAHFLLQSYKITMDFYISITYIDNVHRHKQYRAIYH